MDTRFIFAYGYGDNTPQSIKTVELIKKAGPKGIGWWEIEAELALQNKSKIGARPSLGIMPWAEPSRVGSRLSGVLIPLTTNRLVMENLEMIESEGHAIGFTTLRKEVWDESNGECWLDLQIKPDGNQLIGILSLLDKKMKAYPTMM
ncbi:hypothetical protein IPM19_04280 [bacterium]|nr:MAG: hypothetical protein IPM19_04280 [bacterium]